ncbi:ABSCISIC ACID-INSENSITIVE 5-like protein 2 [Macadamia integrifolia]|uniref:ABSCISIC ACID-INSENSITIVE 5-like protein 2 n=1 Tax=Macadamia integrifolia TaxID=60698 RepID=UPI001C4F6F62|nr:ABSCISIC ACID-INSENSITIVE 5-like protein 2 [Macadamia integrifolia]XP_042514441.1 ABSCISIC ACID-INSENSITIVE 5-like protein 2 [Macadamia integrifolia]XP_042514442.1 ABSCISIC ACID-INSENSITIVE 5-like protein 2 [Macadamia integrifolia]XP_042514444.1 ABSCISIC ACID-INSENSITIVE 5-like protein 2 [Macadamia integrifolia]XP_042514445.1 ABSCISIC ACID-INSENSITIVE 5-like protein 2 [Macadamia integrifolia]XP_042514446.1 ABSCISIC ACID-INSENSITIVE 5-like protein 2 [Macadamia integrifolia]XP_042514447.1 AB
MGIQTMGSQGGGGGGGQQLARQSSLYTLTLDEVQNQLGDLGKPLSSMNLDELLKNVWTAEANQAMGMDAENVTSAGQLVSASASASVSVSALQRQASLTLSRALSKKTVDEVWRDIQGQKKNNEEKKVQERQPTLGEMTLEDFLVKAGVVAEASTEKQNAGPAMGADSMAVSPQSFPQQAQWLQYQIPSVQQQQQQQPQQQHPQQKMMGIYMPACPVPPPLDVAYPDSQLAISPPLMGTLSDTQTPGRKRVAPGEVMEKTVERRQKRMIKNRESAARSRARKQAYTNELENKVSRLEEENERLKKQKELEKMLPCAPPPEPKYQLRRTSSAPF